MAGIGIEIEGLAELRAAAARLSPELDQSLALALADASRLVAGATEANAPVRSGLLRGSVRAFTEGGAIGGVEVTARRRSRGYPGGFPYPTKVERQRHFLARAVAEKSDEVIERLAKVLDDIERAWRS